LSLVFTHFLVPAFGFTTLEIKAVSIAMAWMWISVAKKNGSYQLSAFSRNCN
jgi:hypothetical protein